MICCLHHWKQESWVPDSAIPTRPDLGAQYPFDLLREYAQSRQHAERVRYARDAVRFALSCRIDWRVGISAGKDSTALAVLLAEEGADVRGVSVKDDLDYPGEVDYVNALGLRTSLVDILTPGTRLRDFLRSSGVSLLDDLHSRTSDLSARWFYGLLNEHRHRNKYDGVFLGLRAEESPGRAKNANQRGVVYMRSDGLTVAQPLMRWAAEDVHAFLLARDVPILPAYLCIDPGEDWRLLRKSWWVVGGGTAARGHYGWLRRWWPEQWAVACQIDPAVGAIS